MTLYIVLVAALILGPAYAFAALTVLRPSGTHPEVVTQISVAGQTPAAELVSRLRSAPSSPLLPPVVITYHDITEEGSDYTITPQRFADQMRLLHDSGWHSLTAREFVGWLHGTPLPPHSVLITFDDGARGVWQYAEPLFRRYNLHGVAFIITGFVGTHQPYYMTWAELQRLRTSGHWDLGAHTHLGHVQVDADAAGHKKAFLATKMWLPDLRRQETTQEFGHRVRTDLQRSIDDLVAHGAPRPPLFAFPFSARGEDALGTRLHAIVNSLFDGAFLDSPAGRPTTLNEMLRHEFRRVDVLRPTTPGRFVQLIEDSMQRPMTPVTAESWRSQDWLSTTADPIHVPPTGPVALTPALTDNEWNEIQLDPHHTSFWNDYRAKITFSGLTGDIQASVYVLLHSPDQVEMAVTRSEFAVYQEVGRATRVVARGVLAAHSSTHVVDAVVGTGNVSLLVDGRRVATITTDRGSRGGIAIGGGTEQTVVLNRVTVDRVSGP